jgi:hypothetical protein
MITVAMHQPDLLPYPGFWLKMAKADVFEIGIYYQFTKRGYQRRVTMRDQWATVPVIGEPFRSPINEVRIDPDKARAALINTIRGRYAGARYWKLRGDDLIGLIENSHTDKLWQFILDLILAVRDMLGITTPIAIGAPLKGVKSEAVVHALQQYGTSVHHLSGPGARVYMNEHGEFDEAGITYDFTRPASVTADSVVTVLMDYRDPLEVVLREETA